MSSNHKAIVAIGIVLMGLGGMVVVGGLLSESAIDREAMLMVGGLMGVIGLALILLAVLLAKRSKAKRQWKPSKVVLDPALELPGLMRVEFTDRTALPAICACCGQPTRDTSTHRMANISTAYQKYDASRMGPLPFLLIWKKMMIWILVTFFATRIKQLLRRRNAASGDVVFRIPHCRDCSSRHPVRAYHADFHTRRMTIHAHPDFAARVEGEQA